MTMTRQETNKLLLRYVKRALRVGMYVSFALLMIGVVIYLALEGDVGKVLGPIEAIKSALSLEAQGWLSLGIISLILTPLLGIVAALVVFVRAKEQRMAGVALLVIGVVALAIMVKMIV